ncbi:MAG: glycoside hydrolase family 28 protein [Verrucomicrobiia bacterium]
MKTVNTQSMLAGGCHRYFPRCLYGAGLWASVMIAASAFAGDAASKFQMPKVNEPSIPNRTVSLADFGAIGDGKTLNTESFAEAMNSLTRRGGGKLVVPPGIWLTGPIHLQSNIELHLNAGALVQFTPDFKQYPLAIFDVKGEKEIDSTSPISGQNLENVAITGRGIIDGGGDGWRPVKKSKQTEAQWNALTKSGGVTDESGNTWWPSREAMAGEKLMRQLGRPRSPRLEDYEPAHEFLRPRLLRLIDCRKVLLEGVTFQNPPNWTLNPTLCKDVTIRNVTVHNAWYAQNSDALDLESCRNVVVRGSTFDAGDDGICLKSGMNERGRRIGVPTENVLIENCIVYHAHGGFTIGSEMSGGVRNVRVNNCVFMGTDIGLRFKSTRGRGGIVEKIYIKNVRMTDIEAEAISFNMYYGGKAPLDADGGLANVEQKPVPVSEETPQFRDIYIQDVVCRGARAAVLLQGLPEMPIRGIHLRNVSLTAETGMVWMDAENITVNNVEIANNKGPVLTLFDTRNAAIDHLSYPAGAEPVIKVQGAANSNIVVTNTDVKAMATGIVLANGATAEAIQIK